MGECPDRERSVVPLNGECGEPLVLTTGMSTSKVRERQQSNARKQEIKEREHDVRYQLDGWK
jgi:hypothetical protein